MVTGPVRMWLRIEGLALTALAVALYAHAGYGWGRFAALVLVPDLSMLGYLLGARVGSIAYNVAHAMVGPVALALVPGALPYALMWAAHVGADRALGFGLKYPSAFGDTHLGRLGGARAVAAAAAD